MKKVITLLILLGLFFLNSCNLLQVKTGTDGTKTTTSDSTSDKTEDSFLFSTSIYVSDTGENQTSISTKESTEKQTTETANVTETEIAHTLFLSGEEVFFGNLLHISEKNPLKIDLKDKLENLFAIKNKNYKLALSDLNLQKDTLTALNKMTEKLYSEKKFSDLLIFTAATVKTPTSTSSEIASGLTVTFRIYQDGKTYGLTDPKFSEIYNWLIKNCAEYGFIQRYPSGKKDFTGKEELNCFRYVGVPYAKYMAENNLCLEEYLAEVYTHSMWQPQVFELKKDIYKTFYVPAADNFTEVKIPFCQSYMISGDNIGGFIVTYINPKEPGNEEPETTEPETTTETTEPETTTETIEPETTEPETTLEDTYETTVYDPEAETLPGDNKYYPRRYSKYVEAASKKYNVPTHIIYAIIHTESAFDKNAVSKSGAIGLMQLMPKTYRWISDEMRFQFLPDEQIYNPQVNIDYGTWYLRYLYNYFSDWNSVYAAYNGGMGNVNKWLNDERYSKDGKLILDNIPLPETKKYVKRVNETLSTYIKLYGEIIDEPQTPEE